MNSLELLEVAQSEFRDAIRWYLDQSPEAARRFALEIKSAVSAIRTQPTRFHRWDKRYRYYLVNDFPYYLPYRIDGDATIVVAIFHTSRDASSWINR